MNWFDESDHFYGDPSSSVHPDIIPANRALTCILCHIKASLINSFGISETITRTVSSELSKGEKFDTSVYPTISLINHPCKPNIGCQFTDMGVAFLYTLKLLVNGHFPKLQPGPHPDIDAGSAIISPNSL